MTMTAFAKRSMNFRGQPQFWLNNMRAGLERATSCHNHDGFLASLHQILNE
jgi:hypothetical protein